MIWTRRVAAGLLCVSLPLALAACSEAANLPSTQQSGAPSANVSDVAQIVTLQYSSFEPSIITIKAGQSVRWVWSDSPIPHDVYFQTFQASSNAAARPFLTHSTVQITGSWTQTFTRPGIYKYICTVHAGMSGEVIVTA